MGSSRGAPRVRRCHRRLTRLPRRRAAAAIGLAGRDSARQRGPLKAGREGDDVGTMRWLTRMLVALLLACGLGAQDRVVTLHLDGGEVVHGTVVAMDLTTLRVRVGDAVRTIPAASVRQCSFAAALPAEAEGTEPFEEAAPEVRPGVVAATQPALEETPGDPAAAADREAPPRSLLLARVERFERAHPWLQPSRPTQWLSYGLVLAFVATLGVYFSVRVAGGEAATMSRSVGLAAWYLLTGLVQLALLPGNALGLVAMLLLNPAFALFWLTTLFGMARLNATVAFAVQLGLVALGYGAIEFVTAVLEATTPVG